MTPEITYRLDRPSMRLVVLVGDKEVCFCGYDHAGSVAAVVTAIADAVKEQSVNAPAPVYVWPLEAEHPRAVPAHEWPTGGVVDNRLTFPTLWPHSYNPAGVNPKGTSL